MAVAMYTSVILLVKVSTMQYYYRHSFVHVLQDFLESTALLEPCSYINIIIYAHNTSSILTLVAM